MPVRLAPEPFDPEAELAAFRSAHPEAGAIVSFTGIARALGHGGTAVTGLLLEHHPSLTLVSLQEIADTTHGRFGVAVAIVHRCGWVPAGAPIVLAAAAAAHRRAAFDACDQMMDRLKTDAVFWKREDAVDGSRWIEPTAIDRAVRARWSE